MLCDILCAVCIAFTFMLWDVYYLDQSMLPWYHEAWQVIVMWPTSVSIQIFKNMQGRLFEFSCLSLRLNAREQNRIKEPIKSLKTTCRSRQVIQTSTNNRDTDIRASRTFDVYMLLVVELFLIVHWKHQRGVMWSVSMTNLLHIKVSIIKIPSYHWPYSSNDYHPPHIGTHHYNSLHNPTVKNNLAC